MKSSLGEMKKVALFPLLIEHISLVVVVTMPMEHAFFAPFYSSSAAVRIYE
jgi:hypothetical protein